MTNQKNVSDHSIILKYFPEINNDQKNKFRLLLELYKDWNSRINLISRKEIDFLYERHVLHSLGIAKIISFNPGTEVLDVGTGGGFPGIPLAILFPEVRFHLVDSIGKKIKVVNEIASSLELKNVTAEKIRAEDLKGSYHFVVTRAVAETPVICGWVKDRISKEQFNSFPNGLLLLKGGDLNAELHDFHEQASIFELKDFFKEDFFETKRLVSLSFLQTGNPI